MKNKVSAKSVFKIFGENPHDALNRLRSGETKGEIFEGTGQTVGVQDVNFDVEEGRIFVVMGLSGSGKSTLIRMINGLIKPTAGSILIDEVDVANCSEDELRSVRRDKVSMVFQHFALFPHRTVGENAAYGLKVKGIAASERREKAQFALTQVGLGAHYDSYPEELSGGMQQRVGLARGLASESQVLLMDEPFSALDPLIRRDMQEELLELQRSMHKTIIFITHDLDEALILGDKIAIMKDGRFVQMGTAQEIVGNPADEYVTAFTQGIDRSRVFTAGSIAEAPEAVDLAAAQPQQMLERMETLGRDALFVTRGPDIAGIVTYRDLSASLRKADGTIEPLLITDYATIDADAYLYQIYAAAGTGLPVAVIEDDRFVGVIDPAHVLQHLTPGERAEVDDRTAKGCAA